MIIEDSSSHILSGGTVNRLSLDRSTGVVSKQYLVGNGISGSANQRLIAESTSLRIIPYTPKLLGVDPNVVHMEYLRGETDLDETVSYLPESCQTEIYHTAGQVLQEVHSHLRGRCNGRDVSQEFFRRSLVSLNEVKDILTSQGISTNKVIDYLHSNLPGVKDQVSKRGLSWTQGDYWLNNLIGHIRDRHFSLSGVIDWELASYTTPYVDYASVFLSIEMPHPESSGPFWKGYGNTPDHPTIRYFAIIKMLDWLSHDPEADLNSHFYFDKINFMRKEISNAG